MRELTLTDMERLGAFDEAERTFQMTEEAFRSFYELTARPVRIYLARMTGDDRLADDLLQETYYRFLRANVAFENDDHRRRYLYRIATNLVHDHRRRPHVEVASTSLPEPRPIFTEPNVAERAARRIDLQRAMARLKPRERSMLWLAYALGWSHEEIAASIGVKTGSLKPMLHAWPERAVARCHGSDRGRRVAGDSHRRVAVALATGRSRLGCGRGIFPERRGRVGARVGTAPQRDARPGCRRVAAARATGAVLRAVGRVIWFGYSLTLTKRPSEKHFAVIAGID